MKRTVAVLLIIALCLLSVPIRSSANVLTTNTYGDFIVSSGESLDEGDCTYEDGKLLINTSKTLIIKTQSATEDVIQIEAGVNADIVLAGVTINSGYECIKIADMSTGNTNITLADNTVNTLVSTKRSAISKTGSYIKKEDVATGELTITCEHADELMQVATSFI